MDEQISVIDDVNLDVVTETMSKINSFQKLLQRELKQGRDFDIVANDDIIDIPATYAPIYVQTKLFEKTVSILLKDFLEDEGFYSIGEESPRMHGYNLLSEKNSWYALELN